MRNDRAAPPWYNPAMTPPEADREASRRASEELCRAAEAALSDGDYGNAERLGLEAILASQGQGDLLLARGLSALARVYVRTANAEAAEALHRRAMAIRQSVGGEELGVESLNALACCIWRRGDATGAERLLRKAMEIQHRAPGRYHPRLMADTVNNLGILAAGRGDFSAAESLFRQSLALKQQVSGPDSVPVAEVLNNLGHYLTKAGRAADAVPLLRRAVAIHDHLLPPEHPGHANALTNLGGALAVLGRLQEAEPLLERARSIDLKFLGGRHPGLFMATHELAQVLRQTGRRDAAEPLFLHAIELCERHFPRSLDRAIALSNYGSMLVEEGHFSSAAPRLLEAAEAFAASQGWAHRATVDGHLRAGACCRNCGKLDEACTSIRRAIRALLRGRDSLEPDLPDIVDYYAVVLAERGRNDRAALALDFARVLRGTMLDGKSDDNAAS